MIDICILAIIGIAFLNYALVPDGAYPPFLFSMVWLMVLLCHSVIGRFSLLEIHPLSGEALALFGLGVLFFSIGGMVNRAVNHSPINAANHVPRAGFVLHPLVDVSLLAIPISLFPLYLQKAILLSSQSGLESFFIGLRAQITSRQDDYGLLKYAAFLALFSVFIRVLTTDDRRGGWARARLFLSILVAFGYAFLTTGRSSMMLLLTLILGSKFLHDRFTLRDYALAMVFSAGIFSFFAVVLAKGGSVRFSVWQNIVGVVQTFFRYLVSPLSAFSLFLKDPGQLHHGASSFRFFQALFYKAGMTGTPPLELVQPSVHVPFPTNVYTVYYTYARDFGPLASLFFVSVFGFWHSHVFFRVRANPSSLTYNYLYVLMLYPLIFSFFQDQYLSILSLWLQFTVAFIVVRPAITTYLRGTGKNG